MQIITGKTGTAHVSAEDDRALHAGMFGTGNYVLNVGSQFKATIETTNNIVLSDGELTINGTHARIRHGETDTVIIENGTTGYNRIDLIVARYTKVSGLENVKLVVIKGETTAGTPTRPSYIEGNVLDGVEIADMPLYAVQLSGVNVASITPLFTIATGLDDVYRKNEVYTKGEVNTIKQTLQTNINTAQTTANTGVSNAAKAQSTADTAKTNAATAQSTADAAKTRANAAYDFGYEALQSLKKGTLLLETFVLSLAANKSIAAGSVAYGVSASKAISVTGTSLTAYAIPLSSSRNILDNMNVWISNNTVNVEGDIVNTSNATQNALTSVQVLVFGKPTV